MKTLDNFKSAHPGVKNVDDVFKHVGDALEKHTTFSKKKTPYDKDLNLDSFQIDLEKVDRVYHICHIMTTEDEAFDLIVRQEWEGKLFYVEMRASRDPGDSDFADTFTYIFVSADPNLFINIVFESGHHDVGPIYKSFEEDGVQVELLDDRFWHWLVKNDNDNKLAFIFPKHIKKIYPKLIPNNLQNFVEPENMEHIKNNLQNFGEPENLEYFEKLQGAMMSYYY